MIVSPCRKVCVMQPDRDVCAGCFRTIEEIAHWSAMTDGERARVMPELPAREQAAEHRLA